MSKKWRAADQVRILSSGAYQRLESVGTSYPAVPLHDSVPAPVNKYLRHSMEVIGGGEARLLEQLLEYQRCGGGLLDNFKTMRSLDHLDPEGDHYELCTEYLAEKIGLTKGCLQIMDLKEAAHSTSHNLDAHPGPTFRACGFRKKRESLAVAYEIARDIMDNAQKKGIVGYAKPVYSLAGRTKLALKEKIEHKMSTLSQVGRTIFMADQHESLVTSVISVPLLNKFVHLMSHGGVVCNGYNKFGDSPSDFVKDMSQYGVFINADFSEFDLRVRTGSFRKAFDVIRYAFEDADRGSNTFTDRVLDWIEDEMVNTLVALPTGKSVLVRGGMPSGSGMTALVDSIINANMWAEVLYKMGVGDYCLKVQGDDATLGLPIIGKSYERKAHAQVFLTTASRLFTDRFNHDLSTTKTKVATNISVAFAQPRVPSHILDGSSKVVREYRAHQRTKAGRPLTFDEQFIVLNNEPIGPAPGRTHRWTYLFRDRMTFLSHAFKKDVNSDKYMNIRPTSEVVARLLHPERHVKSRRDNEERLIAAWVENMGNHHVTNRIMHYLYDNWFMDKQVWLIPGRPKKMCRRGWYRHVDYVVDILTEDDDFYSYWKGLERRAKAAHTATFGGQYVLWDKVRALRSCKLRAALSGAVASPPTDEDRANIDKGLELYRSLSPLGWNLWCCDALRTDFAHTIIHLLNSPGGDMGGGRALSLLLAVNALRDKYNASE